MVKRVGIFLFPLYVSFSNEMGLWLMARNLGFLDSFTAAVKDGRVLVLKSSMVLAAIGFRRVEENSVSRLLREKTWRLGVEKKLAVRGGT